MSKKIRIPLYSLILLLITSTFSYAQLDSANTIVQLKKHISTLASDEFGGREPGTKGEELARNYIIGEFKAIGLTPKGTKGFLQPFTFTKAVKIGPKTKLAIAGQEFAAGQVCYPLAYSANASAKGVIEDVKYGISAPTMQYDDYAGKNELKGKILVMDASTPDKGGPHSKYAEFADLRARIDTAIAKGAAGVIFYTADKDLTEPRLETKMRITPTKIPVMYIIREKQAPLKSGMTVEMTAEIVREEATGNNVIGFIDNHAPYTIIIGAHYDHLGHGGEESLYRGEPAVHNGADDNASGVAGVIELARYYSKVRSKNNNYLFIAFSGEEKGLLGSQFYTEHPVFPMKNTLVDINLDMIGRSVMPSDTGTFHGFKLDVSQPKEILIYTAHESNELTGMLMAAAREAGVTVKDMGPQIEVGTSDHACFTAKGVPAFCFNSGIHSDLHTIRDDIDKIDFDKMERVSKMAFLLGYKAANQKKRITVDNPQ